MEIIRELEDSPRGVYCGTVGYLAPEGSGRPNARFNVAIRTVTVDTVSTTAEYGVGGGITWDSDARAEYEETVAKSRVLTARRPDFELLETMRFDPAEGVRHLDRHLARLVASADSFGFRVDDTEIREAVEKTVASAPRRRDAHPALAPQGRHGTGGGHAARRRPRHDPRGDRRRRPGPSRRLPVPQDVPARAVRGGSAPPSGGRRRPARQRSGRDHRVDDRERGRHASTDGGSRHLSTPGCCRGSGAPSRWRKDAWSRRR